MGTLKYITTVSKPHSEKSALPPGGQPGYPNCFYKDCFTRRHDLEAMRFFVLVLVFASLLSTGEGRMCGKCDIGDNACCEYTDNLGRLQDQPGYPNCFYKDCFTVGWPGTKRGGNCGKPCECWLNGEKNPCPLDPSAPVYPENLP